MTKKCSLHFINYRCGMANERLRRWRRWLGEHPCCDGSISVEHSPEANSFKGKGWAATQVCRGMEFTNGIIGYCLSVTEFTLQLWGSTRKQHISKNPVYYSYINKFPHISDLFMSSLASKLDCSRSLPMCTDKSENCFWDRCFGTVLQCLHRRSNLEERFCWRVTMISPDSPKSGVLGISKTLL